MRKVPSVAPREIEQMLHVVVRSAEREEAFDHESGPLEFGRGPGTRAVARCVIADGYVSRDHLRITETADGRLAVENLSQTSPVAMSGLTLAPGYMNAVNLPAAMCAGNSEISIALAATPYNPAATQPPGFSDAAPVYGAPASPAGDWRQAHTGDWSDAAAVGAKAWTPPPAMDPWASTRVGRLPGAVGASLRVPAGLSTIAAPASAVEPHVALGALGRTPDPDTLARWFETLVLVQQAAATSAQFLEATARAVVDLVGLDRGLVLLRDGTTWRVAATFPENSAGNAPYSTTVVSEVVRLGRTLYRNLGAEMASVSLVGIEAVVAAPVMDPVQSVVGVVYGSRKLAIGRESPDITPLEARVVQVLAAAAGAGLAREGQRETAMRAELKFEQFFTPALARELAADPSLLEGREREVTVLFSDVRNFSRISERLGPRRTFDMMQDIMDLQTSEIRDTDGVVVDYVGDGLLAMWNAPTDQDDHAMRACNSAIRVVRGLPTVSARWEADAGEPLRLGIGINTGPALVGNTGSRIKFKYGPMGPTVNLASRVEDATKTIGVGLLITGPTRDRIGPASGHGGSGASAYRVSPNRLPSTSCTPGTNRKIGRYNATITNWR